MSPPATNVESNVLVPRTRVGTVKTTGGFGGGRRGGLPALSGGIRGPPPRLGPAQERFKHNFTQAQHPKRQGVVDITPPKDTAQIEELGEDVRLLLALTDYRR
jgi:hypothetical protein